MLLSFLPFSSSQFEGHGFYLLYSSLFFLLILLYNIFNNSLQCQKEEGSHPARLQRGKNPGCACLLNKYPFTPAAAAAAKSLQSCPDSVRPHRRQPTRLPRPWDSPRIAQIWVGLVCIGEGNGDPLQCSCLENSRDGGAWWAAVYGVAQSRTRLK